MNVCVCGGGGGGGGGVKGMNWKGGGRLGELVTTSVCFVFHAHTCPLCRTIFTWHYSLTCHIAQVHNNTRLHVCSTCGQSFTRKNDL